MRGDNYVNPNLPAYPTEFGIEWGTIPYSVRWLRMRCPTCIGEGNSGVDECIECDGTGFRATIRGEEE